MTEIKESNDTIKIFGKCNGFAVAVREDGVNVFILNDTVDHIEKLMGRELEEVDVEADFETLERLRKERMLANPIPGAIP